MIFIILKAYFNKPELKRNQTKTKEKMINWEKHLQLLPQQRVISLRSL